MIKEDYVSFETAKLLKEKGFDEPCYDFYDFDGIQHHCGTREPVISDGTVSIAAPSLALAMKWLREVHHLTIDVFHFRDWKVNIKTIPDDYFKADYSYPELKPTETYEEACEDGIKYCLENLI